MNRGLIRMPAGSLGRAIPSVSCKPVEPERGHAGVDGSSGSMSMGSAPVSIGMETNQIRMESDPNVTFYFILIRIRIGILSNINTK
jgi:hypothetical protein